MKPPLQLSVSVPCTGPDTRTAVSDELSTSLSLPSTPGAATFSTVSSFVLKLSLAATGASFTGLTVMVTVAVFESSEPSFAL